MGYNTKINVIRGDNIIYNEWKDKNYIYNTLLLIFFLISFIGQGVIIYNVYTEPLTVDYILYFVGMLFFVYLELSGIYYYKYFKNMNSIVINNKSSIMIEKMKNDSNVKLIEEKNNYGWYIYYQKIVTFKYNGYLIYIKVPDISKDSAKHFFTISIKDNDDQCKLFIEKILSSL